MNRFFIEFWEGFLIALRSLRVNKMRSFLTTLGIVIGIVTVTTMFTVINGLERGIEQSLGMLGTNVLYVEQMPWFMSPQEWVKYRNRPRIKSDLVDVIRTRSQYSSAVAPMINTQNRVRYQGRAMYGVYIQGSTPDITRISDTELQLGRWYSDFENLSATPVCVIGAEVANVLFPSEQPLGKRIRVASYRCEVIGVLAAQGKFMGIVSFDEQIQMPIRTFERFFGRWRSFTINVKASSAEFLDLAEEELTGIVRAARGVDVMEENNFSINRQEAFREAIDRVTGTIYAIGLFLTALSLVVGGIGVMNIMFVAVKERTKEIGIRKAVGASRRAILMQFLVEAILVCVVAGLIGVLFAGIISVVINEFFTAYMSVGTVMLAFFICVGVGIVFGIVPAWNAARAHPIDALRYE